MDPDSTEDVARTLSEAAGGDQAAWRLIVDAFAPRVFGLVRAQCGDPELAEEIVQSAFCTVAQKISGYEEHGRFDSWVFRIAMNRLRDEMRRRKRQARPMEEEAMIGLSGGESAPEARYEPAERLALAEALEQLAPADREVVDLRHVGGMSFRQMSEYLEEPVGTLLARHHRALKKIKDHMDQAMEPENDPN